ncbi:nitroreductase family protein [Actinokineospora auranticolor]|uniref:Nitroreductase family protein n=1 Tax=Actinokineospora auranticolor TaxID=155976 RepID=A0A2S6GIV1_9PSEU|nr:nitroreductase family protein [Actinokineospora auranticolor]PPK65162.1 nitroreductase family protein [Actinokineospora auranticolor]
MIAEWDRGEVAVLTAAFSRAPSVHNSQPWLLELDGRAARVLERVDIALPRHDRLGRDRLISCGAAVTTVRVAVRQLGWAAPWRQFPDPTRPEVVARIDAGGRREPTETDLAVYRAIPNRHSHRGAFTPDPVDAALLCALRDQALEDTPRAAAVRILHAPGDTGDLARVLARSALVFRHDHAYQRELAAWRGGADDGLPSAGGTPTLPWTGLVDEHTAVPDDDVLAARLARESYLLITTTGDGRSDHLAAGMVTQQLWLGAVAAGLAGSVLTQPLHVPEARKSLIRRLDLSGYPQLLLRVGHPAEVPAPSRRRSTDDLIRVTSEESGRPG